MMTYSDAELTMREDIVRIIEEWEDDGAGTPLLVTETDDLACRIVEYLREREEEEQE